MKRDMELIRKLLLAVETEERTGRGQIELGGYPAEAIGSHSYLIVDAGLAEGADASTRRDPPLHAVLPRPLWCPMSRLVRWIVPVVLLATAPAARGGVGDPQVATDHPWYPGELACSTFERMFATQAAVYTRVTGRPCVSDEDKALAAWLWRNTHYFHGEEGAADLWGKGLKSPDDLRNREYWTGLFAHGYGLCGTTHSQWVAEMEALLGHGRGRGLGCNGHNSFEAFLTGGPYGAGKWVLLDHDLSTVVFDPAGKHLLGMREIAADWKRLTDRGFAPARQRGWLLCGLHPGDNSSYARYGVAEYLSGYAGPPPVVHLRAGETLRRYFEPGLSASKTFAFWGRNYNAGGIPGPERSHTWVNQPDAMWQSTSGAGYKPGQARYGNAVYTYTPDFASGGYKEGVIDEADAHVTFEFTTPYIIAATPPNAKDWGVYDRGCTNGLVVTGSVGCEVSVSVDRGASWVAGGKLPGRIDLTDAAKGHRQYRLKLHAGAKQLSGSGLTVTTVCQANAGTMPRLKDNGTTVRFEAGGFGIVSAGPNLPQGQPHVVAGRFGSPSVTLELKTPRGESARRAYAAAHHLSGSPPDPAVKYHIDLSTDGGMTWRPLVKDWTVNRQGDEPADFWSQSFCWGDGPVLGDVAAVQVRFRNTGGKSVARAEAHLAYAVRPTSRTEVTYNWTDTAGSHAASHTFTGAPGEPAWEVPTGANVRTHWVEMATR